jgi:hypothetical protein
LAQFIKFSVVLKIPVVHQLIVVADDSQRSN